MKRDLRQTSDGSFTLYVPELDEHYHSIHGAAQESKHVFIEMGLKPILEKTNRVDVLEFGFGTGLNFLLSFDESERRKSTLNYVGLEKYPVTVSEFNSMGYDAVSGDYYGVLNNALTSKNQLLGEFELNDNCNLSILEIDFRDFSQKECFDLVYFDVFGPRVQPHLWSQEVFKIAYDALRENGILVTYCAKGQVRRDLESVGFKMERLSGPPGKREMLRGTK